MSGWSPTLDLYEDKDNFLVKAELPGMKKEEIEIQLHDGVLTLSGERKEEKKSEGADIHRSERFVGRFQRTLTLPSQVDCRQGESQLSGWHTDCDAAEVGGRETEADSD